MVTEVTPLEEGKGWLVKTNDRTFQAKNVVVATGRMDQNSNWKPVVNVRDRGYVT